ncbi:MAG: DUF2484 family protein [Pseudomonadota bacterium]
MKLSLILGCLSVLASAVVAMMPMKLQYIPGLLLLIAAPVLIIWLAVDYGWWVGVIGVFAFVSMFRNPLRYFLAKARGLAPELPQDFKERAGK